MLSLLGRRLVQLLPTLFFVSIIIFGLQQLLPGDPALAMAGEDKDPEVIAQIRARVPFWRRDSFADGGQSWQED